MFLDDALTFSDKQAITASAASTTAFPLGPSASQAGSTFLGAGAQGGLNAMSAGKGEPIHPFAKVGPVAFNNLTSLRIAIQACDDQAGTNPVDVASATFLLAALTANAPLSMPAILGGVASKKWLRAYYTVTGTNPTTGAITCGLASQRDGRVQLDQFSL
jgi:hypothetical protein